MAERAVKSGVWSTATNVLARLLQLLRYVVLANLLVPADFGLFGLALLALATLRTFSELGIDQALIQRAEADVDAFLDTAWSVQVLRGLVIGAVAVAAAPLVANVFNEPRLTDVLRVLAVGPLLVGLQNPGIVYFEKDLRFDRQFLHRVSSALLGAVVGIALAVVWESVWALVAAILTEYAASLVLSYVIHDYRPSPRLELDRIRELYDFGKWITGSSILVFLLNEGDDIVVGYLLGSTALGFYRTAYQFANAPATEVTHVISSVVFPAYSQLQDDAAALREGYFRTVKLTALLSLPMAAGIVVVAPTFVDALLGAKWRPAVVPMQILAVWGLLRSLGATTGPLFQATGRPDLATKIQVGKLAIVAALIYPAATEYGVAGVAAVIVLNSLVFSEPLAGYLAVRTVDGSFWRLARLLAYPAVASLLMAGSVLAARAVVPATALGFALLVLLGVAVYAVVIAGMDRFLGYDVRGIVRTVTDALAA